MTFYLNRISQHLSQHLPPHDCRLIDGHVYEIPSSEEIPKSCVKKALSSLNLCFIFAENRVSNNIRFTAVPYRKKEDFDKKQCPDLHMTNEDLNRSIRRIASSQQKKFCRCERNLTRISHSFPEVSSFLLDFLDQMDETGVALDLGCGIGSNVIPLLQRNWTVTAVDLSAAGLKKCEERARDLPGKLCLVSSDIVTYELPSATFKIVMCLNTLPYIDPNKLLNLMKKIYNGLIPNGQFLGDLLFSSDTQYVKTNNQKLGVHYFEETHIVPAILKHAGFVIEDCFVRRQNHSAKRKAFQVQFIAKKPGEIAKLGI